MKLFINDILVRVVGYDKELQNQKFHAVIESEKQLSTAHFEGDMFVKHVTKQQIINLLVAIEEKKYPKLHSVILVVQDKSETSKIIKRYFKIIKAAGGLVIKDDKFLLIYRLKKWDLPKGKLEKNETVEEGAIREVEEECGVKVKANGKLGNTWHTYSRSGKRLLKKTSWYLMTCLDDRKMKPQTEEDIEAIGWFTAEEVEEKLHNSYGSIIEVFRKYKKANRKTLAQSL
ncbi:MAG: NUDIX hydrolase [Cytophagales bacterium]|nr:NUDIX hydrolase [Cytophagales bacterium]